MADSDVLIQIRADVSDINAKLSDVRGYIGKVTDETKKMVDQSQSSLGSLKNNWVAASAAIVATWAAVNQAVSYMDQGAKALQVESSFKIMAESSGKSADGMIAAMQRATKGTVAESELQQKAVKLMLAGYDPVQIQQFSEVAITASQYMGVSVAESYDKISDALATRMPKAMVQAGAVTKEQMKIVTAALAAGADQSDLMALAIDNLRVKQLQLQGTQDGATLSLQKFHASVKETGETVGTVMIVVMQKLYAEFQEFGGLSLSVSAGIYKILEARNLFAASVHFGDAKKEYEDAAAAYKAMAASDMAASTELYKKANENTTGHAAAGARATTQSIDNVKAKVAADMAALQAIVDAKKNAGKIAKDRLAEEIAKDQEVYDSAVANAKQWLMVQKEAGANAEQLNNDYYNKLNDAIYDRYSSEWDDIKKSTILEEDKNKKLEDLNKVLNKAVNDNNTEYVKNVIANTAKKIDIEANLYKTINQYSDDSLNATIAALEKKYKAEGAYTENAKLLAEALAEAENQLYLNRDKVVYDYYNKTEVYGKDADTILATLAQNEYDRVYKATQDSQVAEKAKTDFMVNENLTRAAAGDDFWAGVAAQRAKDEQNMTTWGKAGIATMKGMSSSMASTFSTVFADAYKGKLKSLSDYTTAIWDGVRKGFFDEMGKMAAKNITLMFESVWTSNGKSVIDLVSKVLGYGMDYLSKSDTPTDYSTIPELPAGWQGGRVSQDKISQYAGGGFVDGRANFSGNHPGNDTVPAWLSPGEFVVPRSGVNPDTEKILKYISLFGAVPRYADGGLVVTSEPNKGYWGFSDWANTFTGGVSDIVGGFAKGDPISGIISGLSAWNNNPIINAMDKFGTYQGTAPQRLLNLLGLMSDDVYDKNEKYTQDLAHAVGAFYAMQGAQAGTAASQAAAAGNEAAAAITADMAGNAAANMAVQQGASEVAIQTAYDTAFDAAMAEAAKQGTIETILGVAKSVIKSYAKKFILNEIFKTNTENVEQGQMQINYKGLQDSGAVTGLLAYFDSIAPKIQTFSALNGLDYVPRDNFRINAHKGEAVLNKADAQAWRGGGDSAEIVAAINQLRAEMKAGNYEIARNTAKLAKLTARWEGDGMPPVRT